VISCVVEEQAMITRDIETANGFVDALRPENQIWIDDKNPQARWFFRGQRDASWELRPSAYRSVSILANNPQVPGDLQVFPELPFL
jgi:hypothetical protein